MSETKTGEGSTNRPGDSAFKQQKLKAWQPILTPKWVIGTFLVVGIVFLPLGIVFKAASDGVVEVVVKYSDDTNCKISTANENKACTFEVTIPQDMAQPVFVYYELENFYQNHRRYVKSRSDKQLQGVSGLDLTGSCDPMLFYNGTTKQLWPCGLIANSFFNDKIILNSGASAMSETGIAWDSDLKHKFKNPDTRDTSTYVYLDELPQYSDILTAPPSSDPQAAGTGVLNEHFVVWMRTAGLPTFRKLYGRIEEDLQQGRKLQFTINNNFDSESFKGSKKLVLSTTSWLGGKNPFLGYAYMVVGAVCLLLAALFFIKQKTSPRDLGDTAYLVWKSRQ